MREADVTSVDLKRRRSGSEAAALRGTTRGHSPLTKCVKSREVTVVSGAPSNLSVPGDRSAACGI